MLVLNGGLGIGPALDLIRTFEAEEACWKIGVLLHDHARLASRAAQSGKRDYR